MQNTKKDSELKVPTDLRKTLTSSSSVLLLWNGLTPIARRDFITWIEGAKQPATRARRIGIARDKLIKGDRRPCCYAVVPMNLYKALGKSPQAKTAWKNLTPHERRDFVSLIDNIQGKEGRDRNIDKVVTMLAHGKKYLKR